jgi:hypothetical protein
MSKFEHELHLYVDSSATLNNNIVEYQMVFEELDFPESFDLLSYQFIGADSTKGFYNVQFKFNTDNGYIINQNGYKGGRPGFQLPIVSNNYYNQLMQPILLKTNMNKNLTVRQITLSVWNPDGTPAVVTTGLCLRFRVKRMRDYTVYTLGNQPEVLDMNHD